MTSALTPTQQNVFDHLMRQWPLHQVFVVSGGDGMGKTTLLRQLHQEQGGAFLNMKHFLDAMQSRHPLTLEETFAQLLQANLEKHPCVILDDVQLLSNVVHGCSSYPRSGFLEAALMPLVSYAIETGKKLVFGASYGLGTVVHYRSSSVGIPDFTPDDYAFLCKEYLGEGLAAGLNQEKIHRFSPYLNAHQLKSACIQLRQQPTLDTEQFIEYMRSQGMTSNVDLQEVQAVDLRSLHGVEDVLESLEANIILPLENDDLAKELQLKPRRGVLLVGPPGTGKTTVGRALAHRLKSKFFLVDGTIISGTGHFYGQIHHIFEQAKRNAPSIIFVDDSDVIFESGEELGLYRYLLTMLDGLESESVGRVCVMMTAMEVSNLPPALIRSGRIELWLEMRLPDSGARADILRQNLVGLPESLLDIDLNQVAAETEGFTGADLKRLVEDGKTLYAFDRARGLPLQTMTEYFLRATEQVRANKERYAQASENARQQRPARPVYFSAGEG